MRRDKSKKIGSLEKKITEVTFIFGDTRVLSKTTQDTLREASVTKTILIRSAVSMQYGRVMDGQTDGETDAGP